MTFRLAALSFWIVLLFTPVAAYAQYTPNQVKAVYIFRIASFVHWHDEQQKQQINLCIPDNIKIRELLVQITQDKKVRGMPFVLADNDCDLLFISQPSSDELLEHQPRKTVLISDIDKFSLKGGAIELALKEGRIKPIVNLSNIGSYSISSNFLRVAQVIGEEQ